MEPEVEPGAPEVDDAVGDAPVVEAVCLAEALAPAVMTTGMKVISEEFNVVVSKRVEPDMVADAAQTAAVVP